MEMSRVVAKSALDRMRLPSRAPDVRMIAVSRAMGKQSSNLLNHTQAIEVSR
jgi:hypothetical protein